jgi:hypothetical protein
MPGHAGANDRHLRIAAVRWVDAKRTQSTLLRRSLFALAIERPRP